jgi:nitrate reductase NapE component
VPTGLLVQAASPVTVIMVCVATGAAAVVCAAIAGRRTPRSPMMARAAEIIDLLLTIAVIPLVAAVLGAFAFVRGLGG